jgi:hypothetical protein
VYRYVARGTIEERMLTLQVRLFFKRTQSAMQHAWGGCQVR